MNANNQSLESPQSGVNPIQIIPNPTLSTGPSLLVVYGMLPVTSATIFSTYGCEDFDDGSSLLRTGKISERPSNVMSAHDSAIAINVLCFAV